MTTASIQTFSDLQAAARYSVQSGLASGDLSALLPAGADESWRKVDVDAIPYATLAGTCHPETTQSIVRRDGTTLDARSITSGGTGGMDLHQILADLSVSDAGEPTHHPDDPRETSASFFRRDVFTTLNLAFSRPIILTLDDKRTPSTFLELDHSAPEGMSSFPASIISVGAGMDAVIVERYRGAGTADQSLMHAGHTVIIAQEGSRVRFVQIREHGEMDFHFHHTRFLLHRDASVHGSVLHSGGILGKGFFQASVLEPGATFRGTGIFAGKSGEAHHMEMGVQHLADNGSSSLLYKTVLMDRAHSVFLGNLEIPRGIRKVDSQQLNRNLILSKKARAESRPWLVIRAEDVRCEHGATVGDLDEDALFFLRSRGLPEAEARRLLIGGFFEEVIGELPLSEEAKEDYRSSLMRCIG